MKDKRIEMCLIAAVAVLLFFSTIAPMVVGNEISMRARNEFLENLAFVCSDDSGSSRLSYCKKLFSRDFSNNDFVLESVKPTISVDLSKKGTSKGPMDSAWSMQSHDVHHTGQSPYVTADNTGIEKWRFYVDGWIEDTPVIIDDGFIYFGQGWDLYAINNDGSFKWNYKTDGLISGSSPAIAEDGTIYVGSWDCKLYAINSNGTLKWVVSTGGSVSSSPAIAEDETIYLGTLGGFEHGGYIVAIYPNGTLKWRYETGDDINEGITSDPAISDDGTIYIGSGDSYLYAMYPNGTLKWRFKTGDEIHGHPSIANDGTIYIGSWDDYLYALYPNGTMKWKVGTGWGTSNCQAIGNDGTIYVGTDRIRAFYPNGTLKWDFNLGSNKYVGKSSPAISADGTIYIGTHIGEMSGGEIIAINSNGVERWRKEIADDWVDSSPGIAEDGTVYIGGVFDLDWEMGYLHAFGPIDSNSPPDAPIIEGPTQGKAGTEYIYKFTSIDPDNNPVSVYIDWGDDTTTGWTREYASGETAKIKHTFNQQGTFNIKAKAKDTLGEESDWGYLEVTMPVNYNLNQQSSIPLFLQILQRILNIE